MPERQCHKCTRQVEWGCEAKAYTDRDGVEQWARAAYMPLRFMGEETYACPRQPLREAGAVLDQSNYAMEVFALIEDVVHECDKAEDNARAARKAAGDERAQRYAGVAPGQRPKGDPRQRR